jgi:hypothetical protein
MIDALGAIPTAIKNITTTLIGFTALASPASFKQFQIALEDVMAVLGQAFLPILDMFREAIRAFGDTLATILPDAKTMQAIFGPVRVALAELNKAFRDLGPEAVTIAFRVLALAIAEVVKFVTFLTRAFQLFLATFGVRLGTTRPDVSSVGAAVRPAHITGIEEYEKQLQTAAYSVRGISIPQQQLNEAQAQTALQKEMLTQLNLIAERGIPANPGMGRIFNQEPEQIPFPAGVLYPGGIGQQMPFPRGVVRPAGLGPPIR